MNQYRVRVKQAVQYEICVSVNIRTELIYFVTSK